MRVTIPVLRISEIAGSLPAAGKTLRRKLPPADRLIWIGVMALMALGTVMVLSSSVMWAERKFDSPGFFWGRQLLWWALATLLMIVLSRIDYRVWQRFTPLLLFVAFAGLVTVLLIPTDRPVHRWIPLGPFNWQPAEGFRLAFVVYAAAFLARRGADINSVKRWLPLMGVLTVGSLLLMGEPEFSTVLTVWGITGIMLVAAGVRWRHVLPACIALGVAAILIVSVFEYKTQRISDWESGLTVTGGSYQVRQSKIALGTGGLVGEGLGNGRAKMLYLPEPHTDFIIASVGEELGFLGVSGVMLVFGLIIMRSWRVAARAPDRFGYLVCIGIGGSLFVCATLNLAVATGLAPATGLPLPFISYGGSSLLTTAAAWGIVLNVSRGRGAGGWR